MRRLGSSVRRTWAARGVGLFAVVLAASFAVGFMRSALADTVVDFDRYAAGTVLTDQYADQGVVFGPLPGGAGDGLRPVVRTPTDKTRSGPNVADIATCFDCGSFTPRTTGTFAAPRSRVSVYVGYLGESGVICPDGDPNASACAVVRLRAFGADGAVLTESSARVTRGAGVRTKLEVSTPSATIAGFEIGARPEIDSSKQIAIDDLGFDNPAASGPPDFTLSPVPASVVLEQGGFVTDTITIGRLNGSTGNIDFRADGLPRGVSAAFAPNPASGTQIVLTLTADPTASQITKAVEISGIPQSAKVGTATHRFALNVTVTPACPHVGTATELVDRLAKHFTCVYVNDSAVIDLADVRAGSVGGEEAALVIPDGVTLMGGRSPTVPGGLLVISHKPRKQFMLLLGSQVRVTGLRLRGYNQTDRTSRGDRTGAIGILGSSGVVVENNEIFGWPFAGVYVTEAPADRAAAAHITRNFIHNNLQCNEGQGVQIGGNGFARIDHNLFNFNRHDVGSIGGKGQGYLAELNFNLTSGPKCNPGATFQHYNQHYDMHGQFGGYNGIAGTFMEIRRNTIRGAQEYGIASRPAFWLRGTPADRAIFTGNAVHSPDSLGRHGAVRVTQPAGAPFYVNQLLKQGRLVIRDNRLCFDTAGELAVGDFNGDGRDDVFQSVGTLWVYSPSGSREWHMLNDSTVRLAGLGLGDFNGDGKTDVFSQSGDTWLVSYGGTTAPTPLPAGSNIPIRTYRFGDFDGDRKTDVFRANGSQWFYSSGGAAGWLPLAPSRLAIGDLRFGDFDGNGKTDVFSLANSQWSVSDGGSTGWRRLNARLSSNLGSLVFADFDGDHKTDIARTSGGSWQVSWGGATPWQTLQARRSENLAAGMLFGDFNGDGRDDALQHGVRIPPTPFAACWAKRSPDPTLVSLNYFRLAPGGARPLDRWSSADMR